MTTGGAGRELGSEYIRSPVKGPAQGAVLLYTESRPLPSLSDFSDVGVLCTFINIAAAGIARSSQLSSPLPVQLVQYNMQAVRVLPVQYSTHHRLPNPVLQLGKPGRRVGPILYGLRPLLPAPPPPTTPCLVQYLLRLLDIFRPTLLRLP